MEASELKELMGKENPLSIKFDEYEFELEFKGNIIITVGHTTFYDGSDWDIETSIEKEEAKKRYEESQAKRKEKEKKISEFTDSLTPEQRKVYESM